MSQPTDTAGRAGNVAAGGDPARAAAIQQIERRQRFWMTTAVSTLVMFVVTMIWAVTEYNNAGGWPSDGFSQSSGIPNVWNNWIMYPLIAWVFIVAVNAATTFLRRPISEEAVRREIERQTGRRPE
jgi:2TM domain